MNHYPDSFRVNCVGTLPCNNNKQFCDQSKGPVVIQNGNVVSEESSSEKLNKIDNSSTTHCQSHGTPQRVIQDNTIKEKPNWTHTWSNVRGYGNIVVATNDSCNNIHGRVHPYNRLSKLSTPYDGPAVVKDAWKRNKAKDLKKK